MLNMIDFSSATPDSLKDSLLQSSLAELESGKQTLECLEQALEYNPEFLSGQVESFVAGLCSQGAAFIDRVAELLMDKNPSFYEKSLFAAAEACTCPYVRFGLVRAGFRRFPGRHRHLMLKTGRELLQSESSARVAKLTLWMVWKFGAELTPELVAFMKSNASLDDRILVLNEAAKCLGLGALPVATAAADSNQEELAVAAQDVLKRLQ